jgi:acetyl esterase/lipase
MPLAHLVGWIVHRRRIRARWPVGAGQASPRNRFRPAADGLEPRALLAAPAGGAAAVIGATVHAAVKRHALITRNLPYRSDTGGLQRLDVYLPEGAPPKGGWPVVVAIHGGGWRRFSKDEYGPRAAALTRRGFAVVAPNYTLTAAGRRSWPANIEDVRGAVRWVRKQARAWGFDPNRVAAMGESAGGHLALLLGTMSDRDPPRGAPSARVQAVVDFYGPTDLRTLARDSAAARGVTIAMLGATEDQEPRRFADASPVRHVDRKDPPVLILHGTADDLVPVSQAEELDAVLTARRVPHRTILLPGLGHGFDFRTRGMDLLGTVTNFLRASLKNPSPLPRR